MDQPYLVTRIEVWNRIDCCQDRLIGAVISLIDQNGNEFFNKEFGSNNLRMDITAPKVIFSDFDKTETAMQFKVNA